MRTKSGQNPDSGQNRDRQNPDRQTPDRKSGQNPDSGRTPDRIFRKIRTKTRHGQDTDSAVRRRLSQRTSNDVLFRRQISLILYQKWIRLEFYVWFSEYNIFSFTWIWFWFHNRYLLSYVNGWSLRTSILLNAAVA